MAAVQPSLPTLEPGGLGVGSTHEAMGGSGAEVRGLGPRVQAGGQGNTKAEVLGLPYTSCDLRPVAETP